MGRDGQGVLFAVFVVVVSIHAPAWGATGAVKMAGLADSVSIHAPAWGATGWRHARLSAVVFQSTRPRGARHGSAGIEAGRPAGFNPRARVGRDKGLGRNAQGPISFNPRARVGRDPAGLQERASRPGFNPRARVGRDSLIITH